MTYNIVPTTMAHVHELANTMDPCDIRECWAANHYGPYDALRHSLYHTQYPRTGLLDKMVMCIWGVGKLSYLSKEGIPWMLKSNLVQEHPKEFIRRSKLLVKDMFNEAIVLTNMVDVRNVQSIRWLKWVGFDVHDPVPFGPDGMLFHPFIMENYNV